MRLTNEQLKETYNANTNGTSRGTRIDWLLRRKDQIKITDQDALDEFTFISEELCKIMGARLIILATPGELE